LNRVVKLSDKIAKNYFDKVYVPIYDATTGTLDCYHRLQQQCVDNLNVTDDDKVLCVGVGTGNEVVMVMNKSCSAVVCGIDPSKPSLEIARKKMMNYNGRVSLIEGDAKYLPYPDNSFDKVLCVAVMGFIRDRVQATSEIVRVTKHGGRLVITYPGNGIPGEVLIKQTLSSAKSLSNMLKFLFYATLYSPMLLFPREAKETKDGLYRMLTGMGVHNIFVGRDDVYSNYIITGEKE
jgi:ubiquinone/menaquinone biosynthesis C-methylase UbiE